jgi:signal transduction histidine kinase
MRAAERRRPLPVDIAFGLFVGLAAWVSARFAGTDFSGGGNGPWRHGPPPFRQGPPLPVDNPVESAAQITWLVVVAVVMIVAALGVRRLFPRTAFAATVVATGAFLAAGGPYGPVLLAPAMTVLALARALPLRTSSPFVVALPIMLSAGFWRQPYGGLLDPGLYAAMIFGTAVILLPVTFAVLRRIRRESEAAEREAELRRYAYEERMRIAREVHDVVGHSLSVINLQAGVALHVLDKKPEQVAASLQAIRQSSKDALAELRNTLAMFHDPATGEPTSPQPGLDRLAELVSAVRAGGREATVSLDGPLTDVPAAVDHAAYRIVQEAVTNAVRHSSGAKIMIKIARTDGLLEVQVSDDGFPVRVESVVAGNGIAGMRERALAVGGYLELIPGGASVAGNGGPTGMTVRARLPLRAVENAP